MDLKFSAPPCCFADPPSLSPLPKYTIHLKDKELENLEYRCAFLDRFNDLNENMLQPGQEIKVEASPGHSYVCHLKWQLKEKNVKLLDAEGDMAIDCVGEFDKDCIWEVTG
ncbi:hypothetical protein LXL04_034768 [Taraxacum kok-saghyz]